MNVSLDALVGTDQSKETFWGRIEDYYHKVVDGPSYLLVIVGALYLSVATDGPVSWRW
jgi:hypothetical protein